MAVKINPTLVIEDGDAVTLMGTLTLTGSYPVGGEILDFTTVVGYQSPNGRIFCPAGAPYAGTGSCTGAGGDTFSIVSGSLLTNSKLIGNTASGAVISGAYGAEVTGDTNICFCITFPKA